MENTDPVLVKRRKMALLEADLTIVGLRDRWRKKFGSCSDSLAGAVAVYGTTRSHEKEHDLCELLGVHHALLFTPSKPRAAKVT